MRLYGELAPWFHLLTHPSSYTREAEYYRALIESTVRGEASTLLELGSGGGNNASHLKRRFACTLTDLSEEMLEVSRTINPECEHLQGDMRSLRLGRAFDAVLLHDAVMYMTSEPDLRAAIETAAVHLRPGGVALFVPDVVRERFRPGRHAGGHDGNDGRSLRFTEVISDPDPSDTSFDSDFTLMLHEPDGNERVIRERHCFGLFSESDWLRLIRDAALAPLPAPDVPDPHEGEHEVFLARRERD